MAFRVATLNLFLDHARWPVRRELVLQQIAELQPDVLSLNEIALRVDAARWLRRELGARTGLHYALAQQTRTNSHSRIDAEAVLTRFPLLEVANLDLHSRDHVAAVARVEAEGRALDVYVTHLHYRMEDEALRIFQAQRLLAWRRRRNDGADASLVCGDFNATPDSPTAQTMVEAGFRPTQTEPTAFTPLRGEDDTPAYREVEPMDRCVDYIWAPDSLRVLASGRCFDKPSATDPTLWPSDHVGVWADLEFSPSAGA